MVVGASKIPLDALTFFKRCFGMRFSESLRWLNFETESPGFTFDRSPPAWRLGSQIISDIRILMYMLRIPQFLMPRKALPDYSPLSLKVNSKGNLLSKSI